MLDFLTKDREKVLDELLAARLQLSAENESSQVDRLRLVQYMKVLDAMMLTGENNRRSASLLCAKVDARFQLWLSDRSDKNRDELLQSLKELREVDIYCVELYITTAAIYSLEDLEDEASRYATAAVRLCSDAETLIDAIEIIQYSPDEALQKLCAQLIDSARQKVATLASRLTSVADGME